VAVEVVVVVSSSPQPIAVAARAMGAERTITFRSVYAFLCMVIAMNLCNHCAGIRYKPSFAEVDC